MGLDTRDDAGVYQVRDDLALVQTVDFFTPIVDDPYDFGQIAVANALSDAYAMGATPLTALNIVGFPIATLDRALLAGILKGGWEKAREAGVAILGGHSVKDPEVKYGMAVTAVVHPERIIRNSTARPGDLLILTKPIGTGILATALKNELLEEELLELITASMKQLNKTAAEVMPEYRVTACTDVTGYGLLGHLHEMMEGSRTSALLSAEKIPLFPKVLEYSSRGQVPGGLKENKRYLEPFLSLASDLDGNVYNALCDPQTSGGLLISVPAELAESCVRHLRDSGLQSAGIIGEVTDRREKSIVVEK